MDERERLAADVSDAEIERYFYLNMKTSDVVDYLDGLRLKLSNSQADVPFNAAVKGYAGAQDHDGDQWIVKPVATGEEMLYHRACELAYILDHRTGTLAAPTSAILIGGKRYRVTKVVPHSVQISSYNYMEAPFINILRADLVNRWIFFDEDRNPNNYLVITNARNKQFVVVIDYDKADMLSESMKITGSNDKFGWLRAERTRFLTLLRPENFEGVSIEEFEPRLRAFGSVSKQEMVLLAKKIFNGFCADPESIAAKVADNIVKRRDYVDTYFRSMFKSKIETKNVSNEEDYSAFGKSFLDMHNRKK